MNRITKRFTLVAISILVTACWDKGPVEKDIIGKWLYNPNYCDGYIPEHGTYTINFSGHHIPNLVNNYNLSIIQLKQLNKDQASKMNGMAIRILENCDQLTSDFDSAQYFQLTKGTQSANFIYVRELDKLFMSHEAEPDRLHLLTRFTKDYLSNTEIRRSVNQ